MEGDISCKICFIDFDEEELIPKVLECGHSLCAQCLKTLLTTSTSICPTCRQAITKRDVAHFPTNFGLVGLSSKFKALFTPEKVFETSVANLESVIAAQVNDLEEEIKTKSENLNIFKTKLNELKEFKNMKMQKSDGKMSMHVIDGLNKKINERKTNSQIANIDVTLYRGNVDDKCVYLNEIYRRIQRGEMVYAVKRIENEVKYGKIGVFHEFLLVHSLSTIDDELAKNITTVLFQDVKECMTYLRCNTFLNIDHENSMKPTMVLIEMTDSSFSPHFIELCTGEFGASYKGNSCLEQKIGDYNTVFSSRSHMLSGSKRKRKVSFRSELLFEAMRLPVNNEFVVVKRCSKDASFDIIKYTREEISRVIGIVIRERGNLENLKPFELSDSKILDCGLALYY